MKSKSIAIAFASLLTLCSSAFAHGDKIHAKKVASAVKKEQKAWGIAGDAAAVKRTVAIKMLDTMHFAPDVIHVNEGDTVRFVLANTGRMQHELVIGTKKELDEHAALMLKFPNMEHDEPYMAHVAPGKTGEVIWTFNRAGEFDFACLMAGHYQAGMSGKIKVASSATAALDTLVPVADAQGAGATTEMTQGEVRKVDKENKKITLRHGEIKNLGMPGMTMVFQVKDPAVLDKLQPGDKVRFIAENAGGALVVTRIESVKAP